MEVFIAQVINGLAIGSMYGLISIGFNLMYLVAGVIQFAYPHIVVMGMYAAWYTLDKTGNNLFLGVGAAIVSCTLLSLLSEPLFRPFTRRGALNQSMVASIGIALVLTTFLSQAVNRGMPISFPETLAGADPVVQFGVAAVSRGQFWTFIGAIASVLGFFYLLFRMPLGKAMRAMAQDPVTAGYLGLPKTKLSLFSYGIAGFMGGCSGIFLAMALGTTYPFFGDTLVIKVLAVILFAGPGNIVGGLVCALILGMAESLTLGYLPGQWSNAVAFMMIILVVTWKPEGLFGSRL